MVVANRDVRVTATARDNVTPFLSNFGKSLKSIEKDMKKVFKMVDMDKSGAISQLELKMGLKYLAKRYRIDDVRIF